jgi:hypothetical protein
MEDRIENIVRDQKEWFAPELKKIDVQEITANGFVDESDGDVGGGSASS